MVPQVSALFSNIVKSFFLLGTAVSSVNFSVVMILSGYRSRELLFLGGFEL